MSRPMLSQGMKDLFLWGISSQDPSRLQRLIDGGMDPNAFFIHDEKGGSGKLTHVLMAALAKGMPHSVESLLQAGAKPQLAANEDGTTPLMRAISGRAGLAIAAKLIEAGDDVNACLPSGWSVVHCACAASDAKALEFLHQRGASLDRVTSDKITLLQSAYDSASALRFLLQHIPQLTDEVNVDGLTPLMMAAEDDLPGSVEVLMEFGANLDLESPDGLRADDIARRKGFLHIAEQIEAMRHAKAAVSSIKSIASMASVASVGMGAHIIPGERLNGLKGRAV